MNVALHHGAFSWSELMSEDPAAAAAFYEKVLPWKTQSMDMPTGPYTIANVGEKPVAGIMGLPHPMPSAWAYYVTVDNVDEALAKAESLGGKIQLPGMDVPGVGRLGGFLDPQNAYISVITYEAMENPDPDNPAFTDSFKTAGAFSWFSLQTPDVEAAKAFYAEVFGWTYQTMDMPTGPYTSIMVGETAMGGITPPMQEGIPPHWGSFITVDDADAAAEAASQNGGTLLGPAFDIPTVGRVAIIQDPTGGMVSVIKYVAVEEPVG
jgi:hypothetical protein